MDTKKIILSDKTVEYDDPIKWFENLFGFQETTQESTIKMLDIDTESGILVSKANNRMFHIGKFTTPSLQTIRDYYFKISNQTKPGIVEFDHRAINDILYIHHQYPDAVFQAASQFNCLEFQNSYMIPENGITEYVYDYTQGPACALACAAGTLYRNCLQTETTQINNLCELEAKLPNYWTVKNGYVFSDKTKIMELNKKLYDIKNLNSLRDYVRIGLHQNVGVTFYDRFTPIESNLASNSSAFFNQDIRVTQCYCSAISCGYTNIPIKLWEPLARIILEANYEATIWAAAINRLLGGSKDVFLTFVGGGVFKNELEWITDAIGRAIVIAKKYNLDLNIHICHFRCINVGLVTQVDLAIEKWEEYYKI